MKKLFAFKLTRHLFTNSLLCLLLFLTLSATLISSHLFIYTSFTPLFLYLTGISGLIIFTGLIIIKQKPAFSISMPVMYACIWALYIIVNGLLIHHNFNPFHIYLLGNIGLFIALVYWFKTFAKVLNLVFVFIFVLGIAEAVICFGQYFQLFDSLNKYFAATGSWDNPNVTAMFLAMAIPAGIIVAGFTREWVNKAAIAGILFLLSALVLLQCRTAFIGSGLELIIFFGYKFRVLQTLKASRSMAILSIIIILFAGFAIGGKLYEAKQASADGRKLIWKISAQMMAERPAGYGYGNFEQPYNLHQAAYFKNGNGTADEIRNAGFVHMAYNELLQNGVEGGVIGLLLVALLFYSLLALPVFKSVVIATKSAKPVKTAGNAVPKSAPVPAVNFVLVCAYAGVAAFSVMSLSNFSIQAIPAMALFIFYAAILVNGPGVKTYRLNALSFFNTQPVFILNGLLVIATGICLTAQIYKTGYAGLLNNVAKKEAAAGKMKQALALMATIQSGLTTEDSYWSNFGNILYAHHDYQQAIAPYNRALLLTSDPEIYEKLGACYQKTGNYLKAEQSLLMAEYIIPNRLETRFALMNLYLAERDTAKTVAAARELATVVPKIPSKKAQLYQRSAYAMLSRLKRLYQLKTNNQRPFINLTALQNH